MRTRDRGRREAGVRTGGRASSMGWVGVQHGEEARIPDQTIGHRGVAVDFRARWRLEVSSVSRDPFYLLVLHAGRV